ncbi:hypothetical protein CXG81DRAFT_24369 [Caulochytrium protostelioides]|uniref:BRISC and BRCA1-A complex member 1 n=1 Tax=Caulochytrium protostelioides TaxID=1555241 RepID=A0A4P9XC24_9FUNG|nr:hypothetical protein CXG81DRAFT_24369 [Caulochytrium protostelioides]|eukprot:RKP02963.1 hypothetical protein CXG81DRAFT_24369 [Caulochytrium protostelioides]
MAETPQRLEQHILICLDLASPSQQTTMMPGNIPLTTALRGVIKEFIRLKSMSSLQHQFGIAVVSGGFNWRLDEMLDALDSISHADPTLDLSSMFHELNEFLQRAEPAPETDPVLHRPGQRVHEATGCTGEASPPTHGVQIHVLLLSSRSHGEVTTLSPSERYILTEQLVLLDVLFVHEKPSADNDVARLFTQLDQTIDLAPGGRLYEMSRSLPRLQFAMMDVAAHPRQRLLAGPVHPYLVACPPHIFTPSSTE